MYTKQRKIPLQYIILLFSESHLYSDIVLYKWESEKSKMTCLNLYLNVMNIYASFCGTLYT